MLGRMLQKKAIWRADVPPETTEEWDAQLKKGREQYGRYFKSDAECDLFNMLPISRTEDIRRLLMTMKGEQEFQQELDTCEGAHDSSPEHRLHCLSCVLTRPPTEIMTK
jgi:hypothetical protein